MGRIWIPTFPFFPPSELQVFCVCMHVQINIPNFTIFDFEVLVLFFL